MEKIKHVLSHGHGKSGNATQGRHDTPTAAEFDRSTTGGLTGEGSHLAGANQSPGSAGEYHPIYDQFARAGGSGTTGEPTKTTDHAPHFSNTPNVAQSPSGNVAGSSITPSATSSLHPDTAHRPATQEDMSTASIKSGVIGFPQESRDSHPALARKNPFGQSQQGQSQPAASDNLGATNTGEHASQSERDAATGASVAGAGALASRELQSQPEDTRYNTSSSKQEDHHGRPTQESDIPESGRSFPLAGGVTNQQPAEKTVVSEREPGTQEKDVGLHDGQGREALAGAAAAAAAASATGPQSKRSGVDTQPQKSQATNPEALAAAKTAVSSTTDEYGWNHDHGGRGHTYSGDPCVTENKQGLTAQERSGLLFTSGPHATDTANVADPKLHIPGEFPSPTPLEESNAPSYLQSKPTIETSPSALAEPELRHTGSLDEPQARSAEQTQQPTSEHHYGRDAAIAGGLGAAGVGTYETGKHHQKESTNIGEETFPTEPNPYTSTKVDPRVDTTPRHFSEQRFDPTTSEKHSGRNAALTGGAIGGSEASTQTAPQGRESQNKDHSAVGQDDKSQHHYGRDATLVGTGAAATAGLYASQRDAKPDSGPASSTIGPHKSNIANILDPRVLPNPALQKHHHAAPTTEDPAPSTVGLHKSDGANVADPSVLPGSQKQKAAPIPTREGDSKASDKLESSLPEKDLHKEQHNYGRDAAVAGGAGAAGYGAYEAVKSYGEHPSTQAGASMNEQRYDPTAPGAHDPAVTSSQHDPDPQTQDQHHYGRDAAVVGGIGAAGAGAYAVTQGHGQDQQSTISQGHPTHEQRYGPSAPTQQSGISQDKYHYGRDAAIVGGVGAAGAGAYAATRGHDQAQPPSTTHGYQQTSTAQGYQQPSATQVYQQPPVAQAYQQPGTASHQRYDSTQEPNSEHQKRNAALGTAAAAGVGAGGAYAYSQHDAQKEQERQLKEQQKAYQAQQKELEKKQTKDQKHHDKLVAAEEKKHQKDVEHKEREQQKELEKQQAKEQKQHDKLVAAEQRRQSKEAEREAEEEGSPKEKKHRLFGFLHRDKKDKGRSSEENSPRQSRDSPRHSKESAAGAGAAGLAGAAAYEGTHDEGRHLGEKRGRNVLHKDPPKGHPAREATENGKKENTGTDEPIGDPDLMSGDQQTRSGDYGALPSKDQHHTVTEPFTGLPANVERYGDGHGGTDGSRTVHGLHQGTGEAGAGQTNWEQIRKADTAY